MGGLIRSVTPSLGPTVGVAFTCELDTRTPDEGLNVEEYKKRLVGYSRHVDAMRKVNEPSPGTGRPIPWHQDSPYWNTSKLAGSVWLALDDVDGRNGTMFVLPRWHKRENLRRKSTGKDFFTEEIDPSLLPPNIAQLQVGYFLKAGEAAVHDPMMPHRSSPNLSDRWRRVMVCRYMSADGAMGQKEYPHYQTGEMFPRKYILVRGEDIAHRGLERFNPGEDG